MTISGTHVGAIAALIAVSITPPLTHAAGDDPPFVLYVDDDAPPGGDGRSWDTAYRFLRDALLDPFPAAEIRVAGGKYHPDRSQDAPEGTGDRTLSFALRSGVACQGGYAGVGAPDPDERNPARHVTILDGDLLGDDGPDFTNNDENSYHVVVAIGLTGETRLDGFTIARGHAEGPGDANLDGAGLRLINCTITIANCRFTANVADTDVPLEHSAGGGIFIDDGQVAMTDCVFELHVAGTSGGGAVCAVSGDVTIVGCTFSGNHATDGWGGGAISAYDGEISIEDCAFAGNTSEGDGGAIFLTAVTVPENRITNCHFESNHAAEDAGAVEIRGFERVRIDGCTFVANTAGLRGGAVSTSLAPDAIIRRSTFTSNQAVDDGGAVHCTSRGAVVNCWFDGNLAGGSGGAVWAVFLDAPLPIVNTVLIGNHAASGGAASIGPLVRVSQCTILDNTADENGGGLDGFGGSVTNSIVRGNTPDEFGSGNIHAAYSNIQGWPAGFGVIDVDPQFVDAAAHNFRLAPGSPCLDAGWSGATPPDLADLDDNDVVGTPTPLDLDDLPRFVDALAPDVGCPIDSRVDLGAYEHPGVAGPTPIVADLDGDQDVDAADLAVLLAEFNTSGVCSADLNVNGFVGAGDLALLLGWWAFGS